MANYRKIKRGYREDIPGIHFRSSWEANIYRYLKWLKSIGEMYHFEYETMTFWFKNISEIQHLDLSKHRGILKGRGILSGTVSYLIDFKAQDSKDSKPYYIEVKGQMTKESATKIKRFRKYYPDEELKIFDGKVYKGIEKDVGRLIPHWEFPKPTTKSEVGKIRYSRRRR